MQKIWLWTELGCNSDVRASVRSSHRIKGVIVDSPSRVQQPDPRTLAG